MSEHPYRIEEEPAIAFGTLEAGGSPLPLQRVDIHARVSGIHAHVVLEQHFRNDREVVLEVAYVFPAPAMGAVSSYTFAIDGIATRGVLMEREQARLRYDEAIADGKSASLMEEDRPEVMTVRVGNLRPGSIARVRVGIDLLLPIADDCAVLRLPLLVGARYVPGTPLGGPPAGDGTAPDTDDAPDASRVSPPLAAGDTGVRVGVLIDAYGVADALATHPLDIERREIPRAVHPLDAGQREQALRIRARDVVPDGDIVVRFPLAARDQALFVPDPTGNTGTLVATATCPLAAGVPPLDVAVILDRSGSMEGDKMVAARRAAAGIVESLTPRDRVLVIAFDHELETPLGGALVNAIASQRRRAIELLDQIEARGGTEMAAPLGLAARALRADTRGVVGRRRAIVLVTDGLVANEDQLVELASRADAEVLAVAIGAAANQGLCRRLASVTGGACEAAESDALVAGALDRTLRRLLSPALEELDLAIAGASMIPKTRVPRRPPRLVPGVPVVLAARVAGVPSAVELHATDGDGNPVVRAIPVETLDAPSLPRVWARMRIRDLEDEIASTPFPDCVALEDRVVETSLAHGVLSRYTAFVAVDPRARTKPHEPRAKLAQPVVAAERHFKGGERATKTQAGTLRGKFAYLSPEQVRGLPCTPASDVFALGVVLWELAASRRLFRADNDMDTLMQIIEAKVPPLPPAFAAIEPILRRALAKDPRDRYADAGELHRALAQLPSDRDGLAELVARHLPPDPLAGPIAARSRALWITGRISYGTSGAVYAASYAGPLTDVFPDAIVRVPHAHDEDRFAGDPLPIAHPNVARVLGVLARPRAYVIERVIGVDLGKLPHGAKCPVAPRQLAAIAVDAAAALSAVHAIGEVLRSLEPDGLVLGTSGKTVLVELPFAPRGTVLPALHIPLRGLGRYLA